MASWYPKPEKTQPTQKGNFNFGLWIPHPVYIQTYVPGRGKKRWRDGGVFEKTMGDFKFKNSIELLVKFRWMDPRLKKRCFFLPSAKFRWKHINTRLSCLKITQIFGPSPTPSLILSLHFFLYSISIVLHITISLSRHQCMWP